MLCGTATEAHISTEVVFPSLCAISRRDSRSSLAGTPGALLKHFRRELERGRLGVPDAREFDNCEVRVYQATCRLAYRLVHESSWTFQE